MFFQKVLVTLDCCACFLLHSALNANRAKIADLFRIGFAGPEVRLCERFARSKERNMHAALSFMGKALLIMGITYACISVGSSYSQRITDVAKGKGPHSIRRSVTPPVYESVGNQYGSAGASN
jgi:hypothetical protein